MKPLFIWEESSKAMTLNNQTSLCLQMTYDYSLFSVNSGLDSQHVGWKYLISDGVCCHALVLRRNAKQLHKCNILLFAAELFLNIMEDRKHAQLTEEICLFHILKHFIMSVCLVILESPKAETCICSF